MAGSSDSAETAGASGTRISGTSVSSTMRRAVLVLVDGATNAVVEATEARVMAVESFIFVEDYREDVGSIIYLSIL